MSVLKIPMFPLSIFPLPGEMVPLHIFEPRYRQLLEDAENKDIAFGIFYNHVTNTEKIGSLVKLESVIKRYRTGESDIIVKCMDLLSLKKLYRTHYDKLYPGGDVALWNVNLAEPMEDLLREHFNEYMRMLYFKHPEKSNSVFDVANELNLGFEERLKFVQLPDDRKAAFLIGHLKYQMHLLQRVEKAKDVYHLN
ncbi:MAG: LON peptidase substrate-binding domain-containing protein [Cyclobacteriaceae bacterium]|nr:LON peptidase substrate-binding domain-containing protein [Cyclobacteriaceae bacterium]